MKVLAAIILLVVPWTRATTAQNIQSSLDTEVLIAVLEQAVMPDIIVNWALDPKIDGLVLSTETVGCALPIGADERLRQNAVLERASAGEKVSPSELAARPAKGDSDLIVGTGRVVPKIIVARCLSSSRTRLAPIPVNSPLRLEWESPAIITKEFRAANPVPWARRHPKTAGIVRLSKPLFSEDRLRAGVYFSRLRSGRGGAGVFCMLGDEGVWKVLWQQTVWLE
jgi:hypothetical protein